MLPVTDIRQISLRTGARDAGTLVAAFIRTVDEHRDEPALRWRAGGCCRAMTWAEYAKQASAVAAGLAGLGVRRGEHVVLLLRNQPEFYVADMACLLLGAVPVSVYLSPAVEALAQAIAGCDAVACIVENAVFLDRVRKAVQGLGTVAPRLIGVDEDTAGRDVVSLAELAEGSGLDPAAAAATARPGDTATMLYTSGTTGKPKGVPLTHAKLLFATWTLSQRMGVSLTRRRQLSYLPMAHIGERLATHYLHMVQGSTVTCCPDLTNFPAALQATAPHMLFGAPRMWERLHDAIVARLDGDPALRARMAGPALRPAERRVLLRHVLGGLGLAEIVVAIVGSAPLPRHVQQFWLDIGFPLADCYGQTENCGMGTWDPRDIVLGTCGKPFDGMEFSFSPAGEILVRGPAVFDGYHRDPEATAKVLDADGWYHTGDLGRFDSGGNLVLGGRMNDMIVPTSGHNISPGPLEQKLCRIPCIGYAMVIGHGRPHLAAVLALDPESASAWAAAHGKPGTSLADLAADPDLRKIVGAGVAAINAELPGAERIRRHVVVDDSWPLASDLLTATGKIRRAGVARRYAGLIDEMYQRDQA
jgi:long-chain acyl-CoA synthetase